MNHQPILVIYLWLVISTTIIAQEKAPARAMRLVGFQMKIGSDIQQNQARILRAIDHASKEKADFLITPEGSLSGYNATFDRRELDEALENVTSAARKAGVGLMLGTCYKEANDGHESCWNQVRIYAPNGEHLGDYSKILRCSPIDRPGTGEMRDYAEGTVRTFDWKGIRFGTLICNDLWATPGYTTMPNPYLPLKLKQQGAEVIFHAINSGTSQRYKAFHESSAELWAQSLKIPIMEINAAKPGIPVNALSGLIDAAGSRTVRVDEVGEHFFTCDVAFEQLQGRRNAQQPTVTSKKR